MVQPTENRALINRELRAAEGYVLPRKEYEARGVPCLGTFVEAADLEYYTIAGCKRQVRPVRDDELAHIRFCAMLDNEEHCVPVFSRRHQSLKIETHTDVLYVRITPELHQRVFEKADAQQKTVSEYVTSVLLADTEEPVPPRSQLREEAGAHQRITLKAARVNAGLSQVDAARLIKVSPSTISCMEHGKYEPTDHQIDLLAAAYNTRREDIDFPAKN